MGGTKGGSAPAPSPGPTLRQGTKATFTAGGGRGGVYAGAELQNSWLGTESTEEKGTIPVALQGPEAGWTVAPSPTLTVPQGAWAAQVGRRSGWPGMPAQAPSLSRRWQERPLPQPCKAPRTINPRLNDDFINKEETERPVGAMSAAGSINSLNGFLEIVVCDFFCHSFHSLFTEDALPASRSQCRLDPGARCPRTSGHLPIT